MNKLRISHFLTLFFLSVTLTVSLVFALLLYKVASRQAMNDISQRLTDTVAIAAQGLDGDLHAEIAASRDQQGPAYLSFKKALQRIQAVSSDIHFIYSMTLSPDGSIMFVVDAEEDPDKMAALGQIYKDAGAVLQKRFPDLATAAVEEQMYTDHWGTWLSGYAPIIDRNGKRTGVLGVDISAATIVKYRNRLKLIALLIFLVCFPLLALLSFYAARKIGGPIVEMKKGAEEIAAGNLDIALEPPPFKEPAALARSFNQMTRALKTERKRLREMALKYRNIFDNAVEGIFQTTIDGRLLTANRAMLKMLGYDSIEGFKDAIADDIRRIYDSPNDRERFLQRLNEEGRVIGMPLRMRHADGSSLWVELNAQRQDYGREGVIIEGSLKNITERKEKERAQQQQEVAEASSRAKSEFLANMSHEIRTPLNAVMGLADLLSRTELSESQRQYLRKIKTASTTLLSVINDILDFSKIEAGQLTLERTEFSLHELLANVSEMFAHKANEKEIELIIHVEENVPGALKGDPVRLSQILINLVSNAVKFTEKGEIVVSVGARPAAAGNENKASAPLADSLTLAFKVRDTGQGIAADRFEDLFDAFTQADSSTTRKFGGTGLGLSICQKLTRLMGGEISATSSPGRGSTFSFTVQVERQPEKNQISLIPPRDLRGLNVLIVDDNLTALEILSSAIRSFQMKATTASSGQAALELLAASDQPFDLVLLDWKMPGLNGLDTARRIKEELALSKVPIVCMVSAHGREDLMHYAEKRLLDAFLHKPVNTSFLFDTIMELFGRHDAVTSRNPEQQMALPEQDLSGLKNKRVLLVEDNAINQEVALEWLKTAGIETLVAGNGREAVTAVKKHKLDAVLMDIQMPEMDGLEATAEIRKDPAYSELPIIAMTAHALKGDRERCLEAGMNDHVAKPIDPNQLYATLIRWTATGQNSAASDQVKGATPALEPESSPPDRQEKSGPAAEPELPKLSGIDTRKGLYRVNRNQRLYEKLLQSFLDDYKNAAAILSQELEHGDRAAARRTAHSVKGVAANLGAEGLSASAAALEISIERDEDPVDPKTLERFREDLSMVLSSIGGWLENQKNPTSEDKQSRQTGTEPPPLDPAEIHELLKRLKILIDEDLDTARSLVDENKIPLGRVLGAGSVDELIDAMDNFDLDTAEAILEEHLQGMDESSAKKEAQHD